MFYYLEGSVAELEPNLVVLDCGGVGYALNSTANTIAALSRGATCRLYVSESIREDAFDLYGFYTRNEKMFFEMLTSVSGIGPKTALGVLGAMPLRDLNLAILLGDVNALSRAPGIGKKTAQRIALELKDKISQADVSAAAAPSQGAAMPPLSSDAVTEAIEALIALGYSSTEARNAISQIKDQTDKPEELIRLALRAMAGF